MSTTPENKGAQAQTLEERMKIALQRLIAVETAEDKGTSRISYHQHHSSEQSPLLAFYAQIGRFDVQVYAHGPTPESAVDQLIAQYGMPEVRRQRAIANLKVVAAKLGCTVTELSTPKEGDAQ